MKRTVGILGGAMTAAMLAAVAGPLPEIGGVFNPFPEPTDAEKQKASLTQARDMWHAREAEGVVKTRAAERKARRTRRALSNTVRGGFRTPAPGNRAHAPLAVLPSTRAARRREQFGRL